MTSLQLEILHRTGRVSVANNNGTRARANRRARLLANSTPTDDPDDSPDPDDRAKTETEEEKRERFATNTRINAEIQESQRRREAERVEMFDRMALLLESSEARERLLFWRNHGVQFNQVWPEVAEIERKEISLLNQMREGGEEAMGYRSPADVARARLENDPDPDVRAMERIFNQDDKKKKLGSREGQQKEFEEAQKGKTDKPGETGADDPDEEKQVEFMREYGKKLVKT